MNRRTSTRATANSRRSLASRRWESCAEPCPGARSRWCWSGPPSIATNSWKTGAFAARIRCPSRFDRWSNADDSLESDETESLPRSQIASDFCRRVVGYRGLVEGQVRRNPRTAAERKVITRVEPEYPETLKRLYVGGVVRVEVVVTPNGAVQSTKLLGGNPILGQSAMKAVKQWRYAPAGSKEILAVKLEFDPHR